MAVKRDQELGIVETREEKNITVQGGETPIVETRVEPTRIVESEKETSVIHESPDITIVSECCAIPVEGAGTGGSTGSVETFYGKSPKMRNRYLHYAGRPSNLGGVVAFQDREIKDIAVKTMVPGSGWIRIRKNNQAENLYSVQLSSSSLKIVNGLSLPVYRGETVQVYVQSAAGLVRPSVTLNME